jgi:hypothetical protein
MRRENLKARAYRLRSATTVQPYQSAIGVSMEDCPGWTRLHNDGVTWAGRLTRQILEIRAVPRLEPPQIPSAGLPSQPNICLSKRKFQYR